MPCNKCSPRSIKHNLVAGLPAASSLTYLKIDLAAADQAISRRIMMHLNVNFAAACHAIISAQRDAQIRGSASHISQRSVASLRANKFAIARHVTTRRIVTRQRTMQDLYISAERHAESLDSASCRLKNLDGESSKPRGDVFCNISVEHHLSPESVRARRAGSFL